MAELNPCVLNPSILLPFLIAVVQLDAPSPHPLGWESPYFFSLGGWGGEKLHLLQAGLQMGAGLSVSAWDCGLGV